MHSRALVHCHLLVATRARQDGRLPEMHGNWYRMRETCDRIEAELGLANTSTRSFYDGAVTGASALTSSPREA